MTNSIIIKTDGSYKNGVGAGVSFECRIITDGTENSRITDNKFLPNVNNSTDAELFAIAFGVLKVTEMIRDYPKYEIAINSDCEYAVDVFSDNSKIKCKAQRVALFLLEKYAGWRVRWIPRSSNSTADGLARSALNKGEYDG